MHDRSIAEVVVAVGTDRRGGLSEAEAALRLARTGPNELREAAAVSAWVRLAAQFKDLVIWILVTAAVISGVLGEWADTAAILAIVIVNGVIGFLQEERAEAALAALRKLSVPAARVVRGGQVRKIPAREIVVGDRLQLEAGDAVSADARLVESHVLSVQEAALTGESVPVQKDAEGSVPADAALGDRLTMVHAGTVVASGRAAAIVTSTGMGTELGRIAGLLRQDSRETTPLQRRLAELGRILIVVCLAIVAVIVALEVWRGQPLLDVLLLASSLAVAAVPEGLPAVVTLVLAMGLQRMVRRNALVRRLPSVETLGSVTVVCSDKTGTLTRNEMTVREIVTADARYAVTGSGYAPRGEFLRRGGPAGRPADDPSLHRLLEIAAWCSTATVRPKGDGGDAWEVVGDPTEGALVVAAMKAGIEPDSEEATIEYEIPFDSRRKRMSVVLRREGSRAVLTKGAPEVVLAASVSELREGRIVPLDDARRREIATVNAALAGEALRVLGFAFRELSDDRIPAGDGVEHDLVFVGLAGMIDPPRDEVREAVRTCRSAGIRPVMITGDHPATARAIARELDMASEGDEVVTGAELDRIADDALVRRVAGIAVYARVSAEHKLRVVQAWKSRGDVVAMTGDGVNDAPAVKAADIGIAMGITGTFVTKEASDMVLTDDNFTSIIAAIEEGRGIYDNIQKFIHYLLSCNAGEVLLMFFSSLVGWPMPLAPVQILWINLVTDGLPALALGVEPPEPDIMERRPRPPREPVITWSRGVTILAHGALIAFVCAVGFWLEWQGREERLPMARVVTFCIAAFSQLFFAVACRSDTATAPARGLFTNPALIVAIAISALLQLVVVTIPIAQPVFAVETHLGREWGTVILLSLVPVSLVELSKLLFRGKLGR